MTIAALLAAVKRLLRTSETIHARFARDLSRVLREAERRMIPVLVDALNSPSVTRTFDAEVLIAAREQLRLALTEAGYDALVADATGTRLDALIAKVQATARVEAAFLPDVRQGVMALQRVMHLDLLSQGDEVARQVWRAVMRSVIGQVPTTDAVQDLGAALDISQAQTRTLFDTNVSVFQRQVSALQAPDSTEATYLYTGPVDGLMRPFCRDLVGQVLTRQAIQLLDNGQLGNVYLTGGGYNCRHLWTWTAGIAELETMADTGQRVPEVKQTLRFITNVKRAA